MCTGAHVWVCLWHTHTPHTLMSPSLCSKHDTSSSDVVDHLNLRQLLTFEPLAHLKTLFVIDHKREAHLFGIDLNFEFVILSICSFPYVLCCQHHVHTIFITWWILCSFSVCIIIGWLFELNVHYNFWFTTVNMCRDTRVSLSVQRHLLTKHLWVVNLYVHFRTNIHFEKSHWELCWRLVFLSQTIYNYNCSWFRATRLWKVLYRHCALYACLMITVRATASVSGICALPHKHPFWEITLGTVLATWPKSHNTSMTSIYLSTRTRIPEWAKLTRFVILCVTNTHTVQYHTYVLLTLHSGCAHKNWLNVNVN